MKTHCTSWPPKHQMHTIKQFSKLITIKKCTLWFLLKISNRDKFLIKIKKREHSISVLSGLAAGAGEIIVKLRTFKIQGFLDQSSATFFNCLVQAKKIQCKREQLARHTAGLDYNHFDPEGIFLLWTTLAN